MNIYLVATIFANAKDKDFFVHLFFVCVHEWNELLENIDVTSNAVMKKMQGLRHGPATYFHPNGNKEEATYVEGYEEVISSLW